MRVCTANTNMNEAQVQSEIHAEQVGGGGGWKLRSNYQCTEGGCNLERDQNSRISNTSLTHTRIRRVTQANKMFDMCAVFAQLARTCAKARENWVRQSLRTRNT